MASNGIAPTVAEMAKMSTEERMEGLDHSEVRYFTRWDKNTRSETILTCTVTITMAYTKKC